MRITATIFLAILAITTISLHCANTATTTASIPENKNVVRVDNCSPFINLDSSREALTVQIVLFDDHGNKREIVAMKPQDAKLLGGTDCK